MKTPDEIKRALKLCVENTDAGCQPECPYYASKCRVTESEIMPIDALALIQQLEAKNNVLYHTIIGVMHFVDKWLEDAGYDPESDGDGSIAINRAAKAREIALKAIEEAEKRKTF